MPIVTLMTLSACKHVEADRVMLPSMGLPPQKPGVFRKLFLMGLLYAALCMVIGLLAFLPFSGSLSEAVRVARWKRHHAAVVRPDGPLTVFWRAVRDRRRASLWHAPVLVAWHGLRLTQALFFSGVACWRNKWAFLCTAPPGSWCSCSSTCAPACS